MWRCLAQSWRRLIAIWQKLTSVRLLASLSESYRQVRIFGGYLAHEMHRLIFSRAPMQCMLYAVLLRVSELRSYENQRRNEKQAISITKA